MRYGNSPYQALGGRPPGNTVRYMPTGTGNAAAVLVTTQGMITPIQRGWPVALAPSFPSYRPELDLSQVDTSIIMDIVPVEETSSAQALTFTKDIFKSLTNVSETDTATAVSASKAVSVASVGETSTAQPGAAFKGLSLVTASEADLAIALSFVKPILKGITTATETDVAIALAVVKALGLTAATEVDSAVALTFYRAASLSPITESGAAVPISYGKRLDLTPAAEADEARALSFVKPIIKSLTLVNEVDEAVPLEIAGTDIVRSLTLLTETSTAVPLGFTKTIFKTLGPVDGSDTALVLALFKELSLTQVAETDFIVALDLEEEFEVEHDVHEGHATDGHRGGSAVGFARKGSVF